eukprot:4110080-Pleurochrysis_carterae.AAC.2
MRTREPSPAKRIARCAARNSLNLPRRFYLTSHSQTAILFQPRPNDSKSGRREVIRMVVKK